MDERQEGEHFWVYLGSSQAAKFNLKCAKCGKLVDLDDVMGLMMSTCDDPQCDVVKIAAREGKGAWVYVALCADSTHASGKCVSDEGIKTLNEYSTRISKSRARRSWWFLVKHAAVWIAARES